ncbi:siderophore-interacting protein [Pseudenhygromyxa sp. WMMC2535]|uniref:siderophore-interacting protein n=1 Tax=Pseudenhygromyxa sp. WMMC2535 TaxID=2712867 RepID=UPI0015548A67|nr:siderophore-interacting protein [Pseudenhygromyxa sp. WMMC2535]NVB41093.1 siderophore-interacting protein [Pseudenhygromyxa sp. WMMC2535]
MNARHQLELVRHELHRRMLTVTRVEELTPRMRRIHFSDPGLSNFISLSPDDHVKIFLPDAEGKLAMRDYTPRAFDREAGTLTLDFAIHDAGPATQWATQARPGDSLEIGGPRGSRVLPDDFDWYVLVGDETALPAIGRRVESLRAGVPVWTVVTIFDQAEVQRFEAAADWRPVWVTRGEPSPDDAARLKVAVSELSLPPGEGYVWIAAEAGVTDELRTHFVERGHPREWMRASGYWKRGQAGKDEGGSRPGGGRGGGAGR